MKIFLRPILGRKTKTPRQAENWKNILIVRQHNQFGDMLASVPLFRAIKEKFPECKITLIAGPDNSYAVEKNIFIDRLVVFEKKRIFHPLYFFNFTKITRENYDAVIVPSTVSLSATSHLIAAMAKSEGKIAPASLNGNHNPLSFLFDYGIDLNWNENPDRHVSDFIQDIIRPFGIETNNLRSQITFDEEDKKTALEFIDEYGLNKAERMVGLHVGAGKPLNRWSLDNFKEVIAYLRNEFEAKIFLTGSDADAHVIENLFEKLGEKLPVFMNRTIPQLAALIDESDLFITNDTGVLHVAAATNVPQISIFGPTNPKNWGAVGEEKINLKNNDDINSVTVNNVITNIKTLLQ
ncbi:MAG: glycosyltransferase family 9 protein [Chlorobi bacterium]|nr:glycosyltransferase family 9 protein [Chlorobiota bacterium]